MLHAGAGVPQACSHKLLLLVLLLRDLLLLQVQGQLAVIFQRPLLQLQGRGQPAAGVQLCPVERLVVLIAADVCIPVRWRPAAIAAARPADCPMLPSDSQESVGALAC